uniref:DUF4283 domain-containing protein n=1 Tax=Populus alba TaxID=43335 RepID=A0A4U5NQ98_POPAL|nr:hypothetical protein D5086_0000250250 [Populus alba]
MAKNKRTTPAPPLPPSPPTLTPSPKAVAGGSSPDKFLIFAEEGSIPQPIVSSPSTPDHVIVKDYSDEEDYEEDEVDYSASRGNSRSFHSPVPPSIGNNLDITLNSASRVLPLSGSGHLVIPVTTPTKRRSSPVPALQHNFLGLVEVDHNLPNVISSPTEAPHSGTPHSHALSPGFKALNNIISSSWKCEASLAIHESGWLVYRFKNIDDKRAVLANGPYLIYGRPLILKAMPKYFDFGTDETSCVPVWVKFPNLSLKCWSPRCLAKIASKVLVELDLLTDLKSSIVINLPNGATLNQPVIYKTLPRFCKLCKVLGHKTGACTPPLKPVVASPVGKHNHPATTTNKDRSVFDRLGPVDEPSLGKAKGQIADHVSTIHPSSKAPAVLSSGATCTPDYNSPIIIHEKELARATPSRTDPNEVPVGIATKRGQRRSLSRASGSGSGGRVLPSPAII